MIEEHPKSVTVERGTAVNFNCTVRDCKATVTIEWRIGAFQIGSESYLTPKILYNAGIIQRFLSPPCSASGGKQKTEIIEIFPTTSSWNETAVQCREVRQSEKKLKKFYSAFALLLLEPESDTIPEPG